MQLHNRRWSRHTNTHTHKHTQAIVSNEVTRRAPVSAPCSDVGSVAGSVAAGPYRRKVDALKCEIEGLRRNETSAASSRLTSPAPSVRSGVSTACTARSAVRNNGHGSGGGKTGDVQAAWMAGAKGSERGVGVGAAGVRWQQQQQEPRAGSARRYSPPQGGGVGVQQTSRLREGLMRMREQANLMDSLDLDSPAHRRKEVPHRNNNMHVGEGKRLNLYEQAACLAHESLVESLDLSTSGPLSGMIKAQDWLKQAVSAALQHAPAPPSVAERRLAPRLPGGNAQQGTRAGGEQDRKHTQQYSARGLQQHQVCWQERGTPASAGGSRSRPTAPKHVTVEEACIANEEEMLLKSLARLDAKLLHTKHADAAAAYVAACDYAAAQSRGQSASEKDPVARGQGAVIRAPPLTHWNSHQDLQREADHCVDGGVWDGQKAAAVAGLRKLVAHPPQALARDRRIRGAKNK
jgi:hypothetical protein